MMGAQRRGPRTITLTNREELERKNKLAELLGVSMQQLIAMESDGTLDGALRQAGIGPSTLSSKEPDRPQLKPVPIPEPKPLSRVPVHLSEGSVADIVARLESLFQGELTTLSNHKTPASLKGYFTELRGRVRRQTGCNFYEAEQMVTAVNLFVRLVDWVEEENPDFWNEVQKECDRDSYGLHVQAHLLHRLEKLISAVAENNEK